MEFPFVRFWKLADGIGIAPTQPGGSLGFRDRGITALPTIRGQGGRSCTLVAVRKHPPRSERGRLLLTLHPENGCQTWTRTKTSGLTGRRATLTLPGNGATGRIGFPSPANQLPKKRRSLREKQSHLHRSV